MGEGCVLGEVDGDVDLGGFSLFGVAVRFCMTFITAAILAGFNLDLICGLFKRGKRDKSVLAAGESLDLVVEVPFKTSPSSD